MNRLEFSFSLVFLSHVPIPMQEIERERKIRRLVKHDQLRCSILVFDFMCCINRYTEFAYDIYGYYFILSFSVITEIRSILTFRLNKYIEEHSNEKINLLLIFNSRILRNKNLFLE